jgi:hypothetical protein
MVGEHVLAELVLAELLRIDDVVEALDFLVLVLDDDVDAGIVEAEMLRDIRGARDPATRDESGGIADFAMGFWLAGENERAGIAPGPSA